MMLNARADLVLTRVPIGEIFEAEDDRKWIFIGWRRNTAGHEMVFVRSVKGSDRGDPFLYYASMTATLIKKFPALDRYRKQDDQS